MKNADEVIGLPYFVLLIFGALAFFIAEPTHANTTETPQNCAVVDPNGNIVNVIVADPSVDASPVAGDTLMAKPNAQIGGTIIDGKYTPPAAPTPPTPSPAQVARAALANGLAVTSASHGSALNGTYALDQTSQNSVNATITYILLNGTFPGGGTAMPWIDKSGAAHTWPSIEEFKAFATAYTNYVTAVSLYAASNGAAGSLPSNRITIP
jgi:hypothetical protein